MANLSASRAPSLQSLCGSRLCFHREVTGKWVCRNPQATTWGRVLVSGAGEERKGGRYYLLSNLGSGTELCVSVSCGGAGQQWTAAGAEALGAVDLGMALALLEEIAINPP